MDTARVVLLPATEPGDKTYGTMPDRIAGGPEAAVHHVRFPNQVWYNEAVRARAIAQIEALGADPVVLVGFSKSALGAWNILRTVPDRVVAVILFDGPVARGERPPWGTDPFYADDAAWREDLPLRTVPDMAAAVAGGRRLVLISGEAFHDEMCVLARALAAASVPHAFLPRPRLRHHWRSGWIEEGWRALVMGREKRSRQDVIQYP